MVRWKVFVGGKQRGGDYDNEPRAVEAGKAISTSFRQVYVYKVVDDNNSKQVAKWIDGNRVD